MLKKMQKENAIKATYVRILSEDLQIKEAAQLDLPTIPDGSALMLLKKERNARFQESWCLAQETASEIKTALARINSTIPFNTVLRN